MNATFRKKASLQYNENKSDGFTLKLWSGQIWKMNDTDLYWLSCKKESSRQNPIASLIAT